MLRMATRSDALAIEGFLHQHFDTSMFLLGNLYRFGLEPNDDPHFTRMYIWQDKRGVRAVFGRTNNGFLLCQMPEHLSEALEAFAVHMAGETISGITGAAGQVPFILKALGIDRAPWKYQLDEPLYTLDLDELVMPPRGDTDVLRRPTPRDLPLLTEWLRGYEIETGVARPGPAHSRAVEMRAREMLDDPEVRLMDRAGQPVAMTTFTGRMPQIVQVGGVYVPPELRSHGLGRLVVALHLEEARRAGVERALLFAANLPAMRAYESLGFQMVGKYRISLLDRPVTVPYAR